MARVGSAFTGQDDETDGPTKSIMSRDGALGPILGDPASRAALLQIGLQLMQPKAMGQSVMGHIGQAIGAGGDVEARLSKEDFERQKHEDELDKTNRTLDIRQQEADAYAKGQEAAAARGARTDALTLEQLRQQGRVALQGNKNYHQAAIEQFAATQKALQSPLYDPKHPDPVVEAYKGKTIPQIEREMREGDAAAAGGGGVVPSKGSQDDQARAWAEQNPNDPRAAKIRQRLGM